MEGRVGGEDGGVREGEVFNNFILDMHIEDLLMVGRKFMWYKPNRKARSRIDRVLVTKD